MHGLLDLLEEPEVVLKQAIRDMESEIGQGQQTLAERRQWEERLRRALTQLESSINAYEEQIDIAFEAQNDDLARTFIRKKLEAENRLQATVRAIADMAAETDAMQNRLREQQAQLDAIIAKMPLFLPVSQSTRSHRLGRLPRRGWPRRMSRPPFCAKNANAPKGGTKHGQDEFRAWHIGRVFPERCECPVVTGLTVARRQ
jgi:hypothetical protein